MFVLLTFIALVASFSIVSNLIMLVTEKAREVAILKSMGAADAGILRVFFAEGLYIGLCGLGLGLLMGLRFDLCLVIWRFGLPLDPDVYYIQKLPIVVRPSEIASVRRARRWACAAWPLSTRRTSPRGCGRWRVCATSSSTCQSTVALSRWVAVRAARGAARSIGGRDPATSAGKVQRVDRLLFNRPLAHGPPPGFPGLLHRRELDAARSRVRSRRRIISAVMIVSGL